MHRGNSKFRFVIQHRLKTNMQVPFKKKSCHGGDIFVVIIWFSTIMLLCNSIKAGQLGIRKICAERKSRIEPVVVVLG